MAFAIGAAFVIGLFCMIIAKTEYVLVILDIY